MRTNAPLGIVMPMQLPPERSVCRPHDQIRGRLVREKNRKGEGRRADVRECTKCVGREREQETARGGKQ